MKSESQLAFESGFSSVAAYRRHLNAVGKKAEIAASRNSVQDFQARSSARFNPGGSAGSGVPPSVNRLAEDNRRATEAKGRQLYFDIQAYRKAGLPINGLKAEFLTLCGYRQGTIHEAEAYFNSPECAARFGTSAG